MRWPTTKAESEHLRECQRKNLARFTKAEQWASEKLGATGLKWTRQALWGYRIFDFWCAAKGIAIEIDGPEHRKAYDEARDRYNFDRSGIVVIRVKNFDDQMMATAIWRVNQESDWKARRKELELRKRSKSLPRAKSGKDKLHDLRRKLKATAGNDY